MAKKTTLNEIGEMLGHVVKHMATKDDLSAAKRELKSDITRLEAKIDRVDSKLGAFENSEIDKRKQLEVRVANVEKQL